MRRTETPRIAEESYWALRRTEKYKLNTLEPTPIIIMSHFRINEMLRRRIRFLCFLKWKVNLRRNPNDNAHHTTPRERTNERMRNEMEYNKQFAYWRADCAAAACTGTTFWLWIHDNFHFTFFPLGPFNAIVCVAREMKIVILLYGWHQTLNFLKNIIIKKERLVAGSFHLRPHLPAQLQAMRRKKNWKWWKMTQWIVSGVLSTWFPTYFTHSFGILRRN